MIYSETPIRKDAIFALSRELHPDMGYVIRGDGSDIKKITLESGEALKFSSEDIDAKLIEIIAEYDAQEYARNRATAFPSIGDQFDMQFHDQIDGTTTWKDAVAKVKEDNPKPDGWKE